MDSVSTVQRETSHSTTRTVTWEEIQSLVSDICGKIKKQDLKVNQIFGVPRGGLLLSVLFSHHLNVPIIHDDTLVDKNTLVVDDVLESGNTVAELLEDTQAVCGILYLSNGASEKIHNYDKLIIGTTKIATEWINFPWEQP